MMKKSNKYRVEKDSMGEVKIPSGALYGPQTQRAVDNFIISDLIMPEEFISSLLLVKIAAAKANYKLALLDKKICDAIIKSADFLLTSFSDNNFPIDVFQTGSGTSTNMNVNEVISNVSKSKFKIKVHPNDHVNMSQSSNDVIPTAINHCAYSIATTKLLPSLNLLSKEINSKSKKLSNAVKTGRTHLMDAMPITFEQELSGWKAQVDDNMSSLKNTLLRLKRLTIGGTAVGTGINAHKYLQKEFLSALNKNNKLKFVDKKINLKV